MFGMMVVIDAVSSGSPEMSRFHQVVGREDGAPGDPPAPLPGGGGGGGGGGNGGGGGGGLAAPLS